MRRVTLVLVLSVLALHGADLSGDWPGMLQTALAVDDHNLTLQQSGQALTGSVAFSRGRWEIRNAKLDGQKLTFEVTLTGSTPWHLVYELKVAGEEMTGTLKALDGPFPGGKVRFKRAKQEAGRGAR